MAEDNGMALGYALGQDSGNNSGGMFNGDGFWGIILLALLFGNGGWGGGFGGGGAMMNGALTRAELYDGFAIQNIDSAVRGVQQGICDSTYALNNAITSGFYGVDRGLCDVSHQISDCCCTTQRAIDGVNYNMATQFCALGNTINSNTRDITDTIRDGFAHMEAQANARYIADLERKLNNCDRDSALQGLGTYLINTLRPSPIPAYPSCNPWANCGGNWNGCNCGC